MRIAEDVQTQVWFRWVVGCLTIVAGQSCPLTRATAERAGVMRLFTIEGVVGV